MCACVRACMRVRVCVITCVCVRVCVPDLNEGRNMWAFDICVVLLLLLVLGCVWAQALGFTALLTKFTRPTPSSGNHSPMHTSHACTHSCTQIVVSPHPGAFTINVGDMMQVAHSAMRARTTHARTRVPPAISQMRLLKKTKSLALRYKTPRPRCTQMTDTLRRSTGCSLIENVIATPPLSSSTPPIPPTVRPLQRSGHLFTTTSTGGTFAAAVSRAILRMLARCVFVRWDTDGGAEWCVCAPPPAIVAMCDVRRRADA